MLRDAKRCVIRHKLMCVAVGHERLTEKEFDKLIARFKKHKLYCGGDLT